MYLCCNDTVIITTSSHHMEGTVQSALKTYQTC